MSVHAPSDPPKPTKGLPRSFVALCVVIGALIGAYCVLILVSLAMASTEHRTRTFAVAARQLQIDTGAADVRVVGERRRDVRVDMEIQRGMFRNGFQPRVAMRQDDRQLRLDSRCSLMAHVGVGDCGASFTVYVPHGTAIAVRASSGDVHVEGGTSGLRATASSGDVHVVDYRGRSVVVAADSGDVHVTTLRAPRTLRVDANSGDVDIAVPDTTYSVSVQTGSGDREVRVRQGPRSPHAIVARASSGDVEVATLGDAD